MLTKAYEMVMVTQVGEVIKVAAGLKGTQGSVHSRSTLLRCCCGVFDQSRTEKKKQIIKIV